MAASDSAGNPFTGIGHPFLKMRKCSVERLSDSGRYLRSGLFVSNTAPTMSLWSHHPSLTFIGSFSPPISITLCPRDSADATSADPASATTTFASAARSGGRIPSNAAATAARHSPIATMSRPSRLALDGKSQHAHLPRATVLPPDLTATSSSAARALSTLGADAAKSAIFLTPPRPSVPTFFDPEDSTPPVLPRMDQSTVGSPTSPSP